MICWCLWLAGLLKHSFWTWDWTRISKDSVSSPEETTQGPKSSNQTKSKWTPVGQGNITERNKQARVIPVKLCFACLFVCAHGSVCVYVLCAVFNMVLIYCVPFQCLWTEERETDDLEVRYLLCLYFLYLWFKSFRWVAFYSAMNFSNYCEFKNRIHSRKLL